MEANHLIEANPSSASSSNQFFLHNSNRISAETIKTNEYASRYRDDDNNDGDDEEAVGAGSALRSEADSDRSSFANEPEESYEIAAENKLASLKERIEMLKLKDHDQCKSELQLEESIKSKLIDLTDLRSLLNQVDEQKKEKSGASDLHFDEIKSSLAAARNQHTTSIQANNGIDDVDDDIEVDSLSNSTTRSRNSSTNVDELETSCYQITMDNEKPQEDEKMSEGALVENGSGGSSSSGGATDSEDRGSIDRNNREVSPFSVESSSGSSSAKHEAEETVAKSAATEAGDANKLFLAEVTNRDDCISVNEKQAEYTDEEHDKFDEIETVSLQQSTVMKRTHLRNLIYEIYDLEEEASESESSPESQSSDQVLIEGYMDKLPPGKTLKNSILLAWKRRYIRLNTMGNLFVYDIDDKTRRPRSYPEEVYNIMGGRVEYEQDRVISIDDCRGNVLVIRVSPSASSSPPPATMTPVSAANRSNGASSPNSASTVGEDDHTQFLKWRNAFDSQIIDRSETLWVRPGRAIKTSLVGQNSPPFKNKKVLIIDIGTSSIRAGLFSKEPHLPKIFVPTVCSRDLNQNGKLRVGFDAFDSILASSAASTIDLRKSLSSWSLFSNSSYASQLIFPLRNKNGVDKGNVDMECIEAIVEHAVESLNVSCHDHHVVIVTSQKMNDKINVQFLNLLLASEKFQFESATLINQSLLALYAYNSTTGVVANLGEKIDIVPWSNGITFQSGVSNLAYGGTVMSEYLNSYISRGHVNYIHDMEQYLVRYIKEKSCYVSPNYKDELTKYPNDVAKYPIELIGQSNEFKRIEIPQSARFRAPEGLFDPEIWGIDGVGIHKLIFKAIQSTSMDLRREMARNIYLCGGMSRIPGLKERLELELKKLLPPTLTVKVNCSEHSYHCAFLGAYRFIQQPEYEKLLISRSEWSSENVNCLRKWRMI